MLHLQFELAAQRAVIVNYVHFLSQLESVGHLKIAFILDVGHATASTGTSEAIAATMLQALSFRVDGAFHLAIYIEVLAGSRLL